MSSTPQVQQLLSSLFALHMNNTIAPRHGMVDGTNQIILFLFYTNGRAMIYSLGLLIRLLRPTVFSTSIRIGYFTEYERSQPSNVQTNRESQPPLSPLIYGVWLTAYIEKKLYKINTYICFTYIIFICIWPKSMRSRNQTRQLTDYSLIVATSNNVLFIWWVYIYL